MRQLKIKNRLDSQNNSNTVLISVISTMRCAESLFLIFALFATSPAIAAYEVVDNFESYTTGTSSFPGSTAFTTNGGPWQTRDIYGDTNSSLCGIQTAAPTGKYLYFGEGNSAVTRSAYRAVTNIAEGAKGIYYFQIYTTDGTPDASYGLSDQAVATAAGFGDFEVQVRLYDADGGGAPFNLVGRNGGADVTLASGLAINTWYDIWLVIDNSVDTYDVYYGTSGDPEVMGTKVGSGLGFRNGTAANDLVTFMTMDDAGTILARGAGRLDNIYYSPAQSSGGGAVYRFK